MDFVLDERLQRDCFFLGRLELSQLLLLNNAAVPWFILVPEVAVTELCDLDEQQHSILLNESRRLAIFVRQTFAVDKLNVAAIGNVVSQLHLHVIGRRKDDYCWPDVVWGTEAQEHFAEKDVAVIVGQLEQKLEGFRT
jgi:diadenosine tetraphosphate (Ap4A) HIT family hydrolase